MLRTRFLTAAIALPAILAAILFLPDWAFSLLIGILGLWGLYEIFEMLPRKDAPTTVQLALYGALPLVALLLYPDLPQHSHAFAMYLAAFIALSLAVPIVRVSVRGPEPLRSQHYFFDGIVAAQIASVGCFFPMFAIVRNGPNGVALIILMLLLVVCADSGAYFVGRAIGRHKLAFKVSPGKTIEGAIGGILASIAGGLILRGWLIPGWSIGGTAIFSAIIAVLAIIGDLANSAFKRVAGVKDSGWIFPGHGGLLDRTCSLVLAAVFTYYYSR